MDNSQKMDTVTGASTARYKGCKDVFVEILINLFSVFQLYYINVTVNFQFKDFNLLKALFVVI